NTETTALPPSTREWLDALGFTVLDDARWLRALTHGSFNGSVSAKSGHESAGTTSGSNFWVTGCWALPLPPGCFAMGTPPKGSSHND
ncbi:MAG: hypothetical protein AAFY19_05100, partial [Pseudomonadota bacterium]